MSGYLHFVEHRLQEIALMFMGAVYVIRLGWLMHFTAGRERQAPTGTGVSSPRKGVIYSWANIAMPWTMESTRTHYVLYVQFVIFHLGVTAAIALSFIIPYAPAMLTTASFVYLFQAVIGAAFLVGIMRLIRRMRNVYIRSISSPDDYFSLILLTCWFFFAFFSTPNEATSGEWHLLAYFILTAFFLVYVPFSKISHYLYYPFTRYYLGKSLSRRGVYPVKRFS